MVVRARNFVESVFPFSPSVYLPGGWTGVWAGVCSSFHTFSCIKAFITYLELNLRGLILWSSSKIHKGTPYSSEYLHLVNRSAFGI